MLLLSQVCPVSKVVDVEITSKWEECQSCFIGRSHGMGNIILSIWENIIVTPSLGSSILLPSKDSCWKAQDHMFLLTLTIFMLRILPQMELLTYTSSWYVVMCTAPCPKGLRRMRIVGCTSLERNLTAWYEQFHFSSSKSYQYDINDELVFVCLFFLCNKLPQV